MCQSSLYSGNGGYNWLICRDIYLVLYDWLIYRELDLVVYDWLIYRDIDLVYHWLMYTDRVPSIVVWGLQLADIL